MNKTMKWSSALLLAVATTWLGASDVSAADAKTMPASGCTPTAVAVPQWTALTSNWVGSINNPNYNNVLVTCPIVRDDTAGVLNYIEVMVQDRNGGAGDLQCWAESISKTGNLYWDAAAQAMTPAGSSSSWQSLKMWPTKDYDFGSFVLQCWLPAAIGSNASDQSGILSYYYEED